MSIFYSPLRYPGGKAKLSTFLAEIIKTNELQGGTYVEAYAGGSGAALKLLFSNIVDKIVLNDLDEFISSFWFSACHHTDELIKLIQDTKITIEEYNKQKQNIYTNTNELSQLEKAFTCFFLNRTNRSGILTAGPIGGKNQTGDWKLNARFNKKDLIERIKLIGLNKNKIEVYNLDSIVFLENYFSHLPMESSKILIYLDPPYYKKGNDLYRLAYSNEHHQKLSKFIKNQNFRWVLSYDDSLFIKNLYDDQRLERLAMNYFASKVKIGEEVIFCSRNCLMPEKVEGNSKYIFTPIRQKEFLEAMIADK